MSVQLKYFTTLANPDKCDFTESTIYELTDVQTVESLINLSGIKIDDVKITSKINHLFKF
jgi:hypothetical protein